MTNDTQQTDARLLMLMQWLKDNDESDTSMREHANKDSQYIPDLLDGPDYD
jgi:hypothetical protein